MAILNLAWYNHTLFILHILTYYDFLSILFFLEIWIVIKKVDVSKVIFCLFEYIYIYIYIYLYIYIYIYLYIYIHISTKDKFLAPPPEHRTLTSFMVPKHLNLKVLINGAIECPEARDNRRTQYKWV